MTEMWERFSYYGMRAACWCCISSTPLHYDRADADLYGIYTSLVYLTPMFGGALADKYLFGGRAAGHHRRRCDDAGPLGHGLEPLLNLALGLLIIGNGFFKPNTTTMVGEPCDGEKRSPSCGWLLDLLHGHQPGRFPGLFVAGTFGEKVAGTGASAQRPWAWPSA